MAAEVFAICINDTIPSCILAMFQQPQSLLLRQSSGLKWLPVLRG